MQSTYNSKQGLQIGDWRVETWGEGGEMGVGVGEGEKKGGGKNRSFFKLSSKVLKFKYIFFSV